MSRSDIVFDIETKFSFDEVGGRNNFHKLGISVVGAYCYDGDKYIAFEEHEVPLFEKLVNESRSAGGRLIGFNIHHFDIPVLQPYISWNLKELSTLDLMDDVERGVGFRVSLDNLCTETLGAKKSADGMQALRWYKEGKIQEIKEYCLKDVELTRKLFEFGAANGHVLFYARDRNGKVAVPVHWGDNQPADVRSIIRDGLVKRKSIEIEYVTKDAADNAPLNFRLVDVHKIFGDSFEGYCHLRKSKRAFRIDRVLSASLTDTPYKMVEDVQWSLL